ncbi:MAG: DUF433 domain-containing protein [bacterium]
MSVKTVSQKRISINQKVRFGQPTITNTRIAVSDILNLVLSGYRINEIPKQYNGQISLQDTKKALSYS